MLAKNFGTAKVKVTVGINSPLESMSLETLPKEYCFKEETNLQCLMIWSRDMCRITAIRSN